MKFVAASPKKEKSQANDGPAADPESERPASAAVVGLPRYLKAKGTIAGASDPQELQADREADLFTARYPPSVSQNTVPASFGALPTASLSRMEAHFGRPLDDVRVHSDAHAAAAARNLHARAFTSGQHIVFGEGQYAPETTAGDWLLAHEVAHTIQQGGISRASGLIQRSPDEVGMTSAGAPASVAAPPAPVQQGSEFGPARRLLTPAPGPDQLEFEGHILSPNTAYLRFVLEDLVAQSGPAEPGPFVRRLKGSITVDELALQAQHTHDAELADAGVSGGAGDISGAPWSPEMFQQAEDRLALKRRIEPLLDDELVGITRDIETVRSRFESDVKSIARHHLQANRRLILDDMQRLGISGSGPQSLSPEAAQEHADRQRDLTRGIALVNKAQAQQRRLRSLQVGYEIEPSDHLGPPTIQDAWFDPSGPPRLGPTGNESPPLANWQVVKAQYDRLAAVIAVFANRDPALYALVRSQQIGEAAGADAAGQREMVRAEYLKLIENIDTTLPKLDDDDLDYRDLKPLHEQLFSGARSSSGLPWNQPFYRKIADDILAQHEAAEFWTRLGLGSLAAAAFILAEFATAGTATFVFLAIGVGAGITQAAISWENYQDQSTAAATSVRDDLALVTDAQTQEAMGQAMIDTVMVFVDLVMAGVQAAGVIGRTRTVFGAAQNPRLYPWRINPNGPRTIEEAVALARQHGILIPEDIRFAAFEGMAGDVFAEYGQLGNRGLDDLIHWDELVHTRTGKIPVRIRPEVLNSDEAIVAVMGHEMHELNALRRIFEENGGAITVREWRQLVAPGFRGNLHDQAWDIADALVERMRNPPPAPATP